MFEESMPVISDLASNVAKSWLEFYITLFYLDLEFCCSLSYLAALATPISLMPIFELFPWWQKVLQYPMSHLLWMSKLRNSLIEHRTLLCRTYSFLKSSAILKSVAGSYMMVSFLNLGSTPWIWCLFLMKSWLRSEMFSWSNLFRIDFVA